MIFFINCSMRTKLNTACTSLIFNGIYYKKKPCRMIIAGLLFLDVLCGTVCPSTGILIA